MGGCGAGGETNGQLENLRGSVYLSATCFHACPGTGWEQSEPAPVEHLNLPGIYEGGTGGVTPSSWPPITVY